MKETGFIRFDIKKRKRMRSDEKVVKLYLIGLGKFIRKMKLPTRLKLLNNTRGTLKRK